MADRDAAPALVFSPLATAPSGPGEHMVNTQELLRSKLLIAGGNGSGKSFLLRGLLEQLAGHVQLHVFDFEGELVTLAEVAPFLIVGEHGHVPAHPDHAARLAEKVMASGASVVLNLSELTVPDRQLFVARYLEAMMALPREAWRACLIAIDEVQLVCPERTEGDPVSAAAVVDVAARGRKRGYGLVVATQRIAKVRKDLVAECHNRLFGFITLPADVKAAGGELGLDTAGRRALTQLPRGQFFAQGPALSREALRVRSADVRTKAPESGADYAPAAPADVQALLAQLGDFSAPTSAGPDDVRGGQHRMDDEREALLHAQVANAEAQLEATRRKMTQHAARYERIESELRMLSAKLVSLGAGAANLLDEPEGDAVAAIDALVIPASAEPLPELGHGRAEPIPQLAKRTPSDATKKTGPRAPASHAVLAALAQLERLGTAAPDRELLAGWVGVSPTSSTWRGYLAQLRRDGLIDDVFDGIMLTESGRAIGAAMAPLFRTRYELHTHWFGKLGNATSEVLAVLIEAYPHSLSRADLGQRIGVAPSSSTFRGYMAALRRPHLITVDGQLVRAANLLFPKGLKA